MSVHTNNVIKTKVPLDERERVLRDELGEFVKKYYFKSDREENGDSDSVQDLVLPPLSEMAQKAHELHVYLKDKGYEPVHHNYMLKNRVVPPEDTEFYNHIHPIEDLLKFIDDPNANKDPEDVTIGEKFTFRVFSHLWGHNDTYHLTRTKDGWTVRFRESSIPSDRGGHPGLYYQFDHDDIDYPRNLPYMLRWLWDRARDKGLTKEQVQEAIDELANWISEIEKQSPKGEVWQAWQG